MLTSTPLNSHRTAGHLTTGWATVQDAAACAWRGDGCACGLLRPREAVHSAEAGAPAAAAAQPENGPGAHHNQGRS